MAREESDDEALARVAAALGVRQVPAQKAAKPARKAVAKKAVKKTQPRKTAAKKAPAKKAAVKAVKKPAAKPARKPRTKPRSVKAAIQAAALVSPAVPDEVAGVLVPVDPAHVVELVDERQEMALRAHDLYLAGRPWEEIAEEVGYPSVATASAAVALWLQRGAIASGVETSKARAAVALARTERMIAAYWDKAASGDLDAAKFVLKANEDFYRMAGLEKADLTVNSRQTIVIGGGSDMADQLRRAALEEDESRRLAEEADEVTDVGEGE